MPTTPLLAGSSGTTVKLLGVMGSGIGARSPGYEDGTVGAESPKWMRRQRGAARHGGPALTTGRCHISLRVRPELQWPRDGLNDQLQRHVASVFQQHAIKRDSDL